MKKIKIAQIGTSYNSHGSAIWPCLLRQSDIFDVVGYAFPENEREKFPERAEAFEGYREMTVEEILNDPESMNRVREMAEDILGEKPEPEPKNDISNFSGCSRLYYSVLAAK